MAGGRGAGARGAGPTPGRAGGAGTLLPPGGLGTISDPRMQRRENIAQEGGSGWWMEAAEVVRAQRPPPEMPIVIQVGDPSHKV